MIIDASITRKRRLAPLRLWRIGQRFYRPLFIIFGVVILISGTILWFSDRNYQAEMTIAPNQAIAQSYSKNTLLQYLALPNHYITTAAFLGFSPQELTRSEINQIRRSIVIQPVDDDIQFVIIKVNANTAEFATALLNAYWHALNQNADDYLTVEQQQLSNLITSENKELKNLIDSRKKMSASSAPYFLTLDRVAEKNMAQRIDDLYYQELNIAKEPLFVDISKPVVIKQNTGMWILFFIAVGWAASITLIDLLWYAFFRQNLYPDKLAYFLSAPVWTFHDGPEMVFFADELRRLSSKNMIIFLPSIISEAHRDPLKKWLHSQGILNYHIIESFGLLSAYLENGRVFLALDALKQHYADVISLYTLITRANISIEGVILLNSL